MPATEMKHFVAVGPRAWGTGPTLKKAMANMHLEQGGGSATVRAKLKKEGATIFASDKPLKLESDIYVRVYAEKDALLIQFHHE